jgi:N-acetylmuramoyl-L-alanine amidase
MSFRYLRYLGLTAVLCAPNTWANGQCPSVGASSNCSVLITINSDGKLSFEVDPTVPPYDNIEDVLVGVVNKSGATVFGIYLAGNDIFGFDGDGAFGGYEGPNTSFTLIDANSGTVNFTNGLDNNGFIYFSLEGAPSSLRLASTITIDPGHGTTCPAVNQASGAVGTKSYTTAPAGPLKEDNLTVNVGNILGNTLSGGNYKVTMTKTDITSCPTLRERGTIANNARSNMFVSVHFDSPANLLTSIFKPPGSLGIYNSQKTSSATLAQMVASSTSSALGVANRGTKVDDTLGVLKTTTSRMTSIIIETARLSAPDDDIVHTAGSTTRAANGIKAGIDNFVNR